MDMKGHLGRMCRERRWFRWKILGTHMCRIRILLIRPPEEMTSRTKILKQLYTDIKHMNSWMVNCVWDPGFSLLESEVTDSNGQWKG